MEPVEGQPRISHAATQGLDRARLAHARASGPPLPYLPKWRDPQPPGALRQHVPDRARPEDHSRDIGLEGLAREPQEVDVLGPGRPGVEIELDCKVLTDGALVANADDVEPEVCEDDVLSLKAYA